MALDPRKLRPSELIQLINSTPLGAVLSDRLLRQQRQQAGLAIGDGRTVDFFRYVAWLVHQRHTAAAQQQPPSAAPPAPEYAAVKERARARNAALSRSGRDIAPLPEVQDPARRRAAAASLKRFCEAYFPGTFTLAWSADHLKILERLERATRDGGQFAYAMPRGSGKTSLVIAATLWALFTGRQAFVCVICATAAAARELLAAIKQELDGNEHLAADWPEVCYPIQRLQGITNRAKGQICQGQRTQITWTNYEVVLPTVPGSQAAGAIVRVAGITGRIRGMQFTRPDGQKVRPGLAILDDPQTDKSAKSPVQCEQRSRTVAGAVIGMAGPGKQIAAVMPCTVIVRGDLADQFLDRQAHPEWQGERTKLIYSLPTDKQKWERYAELRADSLRNGGDGSEATEFYRANQAAMDAGAVAAWPERKKPSELSAIQHAMNLLFADERAFWSEYQNEPLEERLGDGEVLDAKTIAARTNGRPRAVIPLAATRLTAFVDVQSRLLYWLVAAWAEDFSGWVIDYGTWPDQGRPYFALAGAQKTLTRACPGAGLEGRLHHGLSRLGDELLARTWRREDGSLLRIERCLVDASWGESTDAVYEWCRSTPLGAVVVPSHGRGIGAAAKPWDEYLKKPGETLGWHWLLAVKQARRAIRHAVLDTNHWKSFVHTRLATAVGDRGALTLFGQAGQDHRLLAEHLTAEYRVRTEGRGRQVDEWRIKPDRPDNHWFDCLVGAAAAASMLGAALRESQAPPEQRRRISLAELQAAKRGRRATEAR